MAKKYYAVRVGKVPGIYQTWDECKKNVHGFPAAEYKSFPSEEEAKAIWEGKLYRRLMERPEVAIWKM